MFKGNRPVIKGGARPGKKGWASGPVGDGLWPTAVLRSYDPERAAQQDGRSPIDPEGGPKQAVRDRLGLKGTQTGPDRLDTRGGTNQ